MRRLYGLLAAMILIVAVVASYRVLVGLVAEQVYRERLLELGEHYESLRKQYESAIETTAVTELRVEEGRVSVVVVTAAGVTREIPTPYDPSSEIHVDFVVIDSRLWIRRVYDASTPPRGGVVIDPELAEVDWDEEGEVYGLTVYRPLSEGRWVVGVTGNGALTLTRRSPDDAPELVPPPRIQRFERVRQRLESDLAGIGVGDVVRWLAGRA